MDRITARRIRAVTLSLVAGATAGCQSYEPAPLDLDAHRVGLDERVSHPEPLEAFVDRLRSAGTATPDQFSFADGLTVEEGEVVALFYNPDLRLARLEAGVALATKENAGLWEDPEFGFDGTQIFSPSEPFEFGLTLDLTIPISGRLEVERDQADAAYEAALREIVEQEWATRARVREAWRRWSATGEHRREVDALLVQVEHILGITARLAEVGELGRIEARLFEVERANRRAELDEVIAAERTAYLELVGLLGLSVSTSVALHPIVALAAAPDSGGDLDTMLIERNPTLAVRRAEYRVAEETLRLEVQRQYPDITIGGGYGRESDDRLLLGVSLPVPVLNANRAAIAEARAERELARAAAEVTYERLSRDLATAIARYEAAEDARHRIETEVLPLVDEQEAEVERITELGEVDALLLLESVTSQHAARRRLIDLRLAESVSGIRIAELLGPATVVAPAPIEEPPSSPESGGGEA